MFVVKANRPFWLMTIQQAADCVVGTGPETSSRAPTGLIRYDDAVLPPGPPPASDTTKVPGWLKLKPNGIVPAEG